MLRHSLLGRLESISAAKAPKRLQRNGLCQHSSATAAAPQKKPCTGSWGLPGSARQCRAAAAAALGHARARAHQGSCRTDAVTSAVELRLTPVYSPSWPEYFRLLLSGLVLSPGPDITEELAWGGRKSRERLGERAKLRGQRGGSAAGWGHGAGCRGSVGA